MLTPVHGSDLLILDEFGYPPVDPDLRPIFSEVIATRHEKKATIITSNKSLTEWERVLHDSALAAALADRLLHDGEVYSLKGESSRLRGKPRAAEVAAEIPESVEKGGLGDMGRGAIGDPGGADAVRFPGGPSGKRPFNRESSCRAPSVHRPMTK